MGIILLQSATAAVVPPTGLGGTILALEPDVGSTYTYSYRTDVHKMWNGRERRVALRGYPRETFEAEFFIDDEDVFRALRSHRVRFPTDPYLMVLWHEGATAQGAVTSTVVFIKPLQVDWAVAGQRVWIAGGDTGFAAVIQAATPDGDYIRLDLDEVPAGAIPDGPGVVYPLRAFYLEDDSPVGRFVVNAGRWSARGHAAEPFTTIGTGASLSSLGSFYFLNVVPVLNGLGGEDRPTSALEMIDAGGRVLPEASYTIADVVRVHDFVISSAADRQYWKAFWHTVRGAQKTFLLPTYRPDIEAFDVSGSVISAFYDTEAGFADFGGRPWIRIVATSGAVTTHEVETTDNDVDPDGNTIIFITVTPAPPALAGISEIQWIEQVRFLDENFTLELNASGVQRTTLRFLVVQQ
jgi:hypothetical protein